MDNRELFALACEAEKNAYAPFSNFHVGAALLTEEGKIYTGVNIENSSYPAGLCAERVAMSKAISEGERNFKAIAISGNGGEAWPCGVCRQFMFEFAPEMTVISGKDIDHLEAYKLEELLLKGFRL